MENHLTWKTIQNAYPPQEEKTHLFQKEYFPAPHVARVTLNKYDWKSELFHSPSTNVTQLHKKKCLYEVHSIS